MNKYESIVIYNPDLSNEEIQENIEKVKELLNEFAEENKTELSIEDMGRKKLAYEVKKNKEGYYVVFYFVSNPENIAELERRHRINDDVLKFLTVRRDD